MDMKLKFALIIVTLFTASFLLAFFNHNANRFSELDEAAADQPATGARVPVLVELFTSEGCSSCPPADALLARLDGQPIAGAEIIALSEHVDYWNRLGWADPFSAAGFSERQSVYSKVFNRDDIYTPQMVVDGREEFVGSSAARAKTAITTATRTPKASVALNVKQTTKAESSNAIPLVVHIENLPQVADGDTAEVVLAITESGLRSDVRRGENSGRNLSHTAVVRKLSIIGSIDVKKSTFTAEPTVRIESSWKREQLKAVVFVQERTSRHVLGAAAIALAAKE